MVLIIKSKYVRGEKCPGVKTPGVIIEPRSFPGMFGNCSLKKFFVGGKGWLKSSEGFFRFFRFLYSKVVDWDVENDEATVLGIEI